MRVSTLGAPDRSFWATEKGVEIFKNSAKTFADQANLVGALPTID